MGKFNKRKSKKKGQTHKFTHRVTCRDRQTKTHTHTHTHAKPDKGTGRLLQKSTDLEGRQGTRRKLKPGNDSQWKCFYFLTAMLMQYW